MFCVRTAWLALNGNTLLLEDPTAGYFCSMLDLGYPTPRDVLTNNPDANGATDRTQYFGIRTVTIQLEALDGAGARIDEVAGSFGPYLDPAARPVLHYVLDRGSNPERTMTLRAAAFTAPVEGPYQRSIQLQYVAGDPVAYDPTVQSATATIASTATLSTAGDLPARPLLHIVGPVTGPAVTLTPLGPGFVWQLAFLSTFTIAAGHFVDIDTAARTVLLDGDPAKPRLGSIDWTASSWQWVAPGVNYSLRLLGGTTTGATQATATWNDGYLT
jgi:hypothetical protein